ncbi:MAG: diacylglycerol kinase family lipid kinase [Clostridiales bacterium]|nr:diacylglycerol kinase family lipid kinase [Clostridiales bacterium]
MIDFIVNPIAGDKKGKKLEKTVSKIENKCKTAGVDFKIHLTNYPQHATELTTEIIKNGATNVIAVGGDGTLSEVVRGLIDFDKVTLGLIPCGTGNDFATRLNLPLDIEKALDIILQGNKKFVDYMQMPTTRGINIIGAGIDVEVLKRYQKKKKKNKMSYTVALVQTLFNFDYSSFSAEFNGEKKDYVSFLACVANGSLFGGGIPICKDADPFDGKLNFVTVGEIKKAKIPGAFIQLKKGKILEYPTTKMELTEKIKIESEIPLVINVDGELYENIPFEVTVVHDKLKMFL